MGVTDPDSSGLGLGGGRGSVPQIFQVSEAQSRGDQWSPTCGSVCEEGTACLRCRDGNRCHLQWEGFQSDMVKNFQMLWV